MKSLVKKIRDYDEVVQPGYSFFHFETDTKQKTFLGGLASLGVTLYVIYMCVTKGQQMLGLEDPYISSVEETMDYERIGKIPASELAKPLFEVLQDGKYTVDLDAENYKQYVHIRLRNVIKTYPNGELKVTSKYYWLRPCDERDFQSSLYEKNYWEGTKDSRKQYCPLVPEGEPEPYMQGTRGNQYSKIEHAYWIYEIRKCTEAVREEGDPECASESEIHRWLEKKYSTFKMINTKIDFTSFKQVATRKNEVFVPNIPIFAGKYCDTGGRFRMNRFERIDHWLVQNIKINPFFDYVFFNSDCFDVDPKDEVIAELFLRLSEDQISHTRIVLSFMDFIGTLGGVSDILIKIIGLVFGGYATFHSKFTTISQLYRIKNKTTKQFFKNSKKGNGKQGSLQRMKLPLTTRIRMYLTNQSMFAPFLKWLRNESVDQLNDIVDKGGEMFEREMNIFNLLKNQRNLLFQVKHIKKQLDQFKDDEDSNSLISVGPKPSQGTFKGTDSFDDNVVGTANVEMMNRQILRSSNKSIKSQKSGRSQKSMGIDPFSSEIERQSTKKTRVKTKSPTTRRKKSKRKIMLDQEESGNWQQEPSEEPFK